jgi:hypothetical protein
MRQVKSRILCWYYPKRPTMDMEVQQRSKEYNPEDISFWIKDEGRKANLEKFLSEEFDTREFGEQPFFAMKLLLYCLSYKQNYKNEFELGNLLLNYQRYLKEGAYNYVECVSDESKKKVRQIHEYIRAMDDEFDGYTLDGTELDTVIEDINEKALIKDINETVPLFVLKQYQNSKTLNEFNAKKEMKKRLYQSMKKTGFL